jgi:hypothetical protein
MLVHPQLNPAPDFNDYGDMLFHGMFFHMQCIVVTLVEILIKIHDTVCMAGMATELHLLCNSWM